MQNNSLHFTAIIGTEGNGLTASTSRDNSHEKHIKHWCGGRRIVSVRAYWLRLSSQKAMVISLVSITP